MRKIITLSIIISCAGFVGLSCKKILDLKPETQIENGNVINTLKDLETVLTGAYDGIQGANVLGGNMIFYSELLSDDANISQSRLAPFGTQEIYNGNTSVQISALRNMWADCYSTINKANNVVNFIDNNTQIKDPLFESLKYAYKGEAIFIRAVTHYELLRFWALPYDETTQGANTQPGIVIRTRPTTSIDSLDLVKKPRASVEEVYDFVIADLKASAELFKIKAGRGVGYAGIDACYAMLARVYYYKGDYLNAAYYAQQSITNNYQLTTATNLLSMYQKQGSINSTTKRESIFEVVNTSTDNSNNLRQYYSRSAEYWVQIPKSFSDIFDTADYRLKKLLSVSQFSSSTLKYDIISTQIGGNNLNYIRLAEMFLNLAESQFKNGDAKAALLTYNTIKGRAFINYVPETSTVDLIRKIWDERRKELCFEGDRYMFLRKNKMPLRGGSDYQKYLFKIPQEEIAGNTDVVQN